ncbi:uncharacterized protein METZ01_LOCUS478100 [marine metagenome]|uniref:Uncharacterized protein n=1 Tax=marine metagenome TaxID=408172 RepID=A0A383BYE2_9ZZZZ
MLFSEHCLYEGTGLNRPKFLVRKRGILPAFGLKLIVVEHLDGLIGLHDDA